MLAGQKCCTRRTSREMYCISPLREGEGEKGRERKRERGGGREKGERGREKKGGKEREGRRGREGVQGRREKLIKTTDIMMVLGFL